MEKIALVCLVVLLATTAHATGTNPPPDPEPVANATSAADSVSKAISKSESKAKAYSGSAADASTAVDVGMETGDVTVGGDSYNFPSNSSYSPPAFSNIRCSDVVGFGYTNASGSGTAGLPIPRWMSKKIQDCEANADANWLAEAGLPLAAIEARCGTRSMRTRFGGDVKGAKDQIAGCVSTLKSLARDEAELEGLRHAVDVLREDNERLTEYLVEAEQSVEALQDCKKARTRTEEAWKDCLQK